MKLRFKHQKFQEDAASAVCDVFAGQPYLRNSYMVDRGISQKETKAQSQIDIEGYNNHRIVEELSDDIVLENIRKVQRKCQIKPSEALEGRYNLTVEMETGERVIIVTGCINVLVSRVSGTLTKYNSCIA